MRTTLQNDNKTIVANTIVVYVRLFCTSLIGLFTSRFVLQLLGVSDYGLYNIVGGVISLFSFVSGSLSTTTIRFLNYEIGKDDGKPNEIFNVCNVVHIIFAVILLILAESLGIFYINNYLNVDPGKEIDAMYVFQVSTIVTCIGIINVPYSSVFIAKEKFLFIAIVDICNSLLKLCGILCLFLYKGNLLRAYALIMSLTTLSSFIIYHYFSYKNWQEIVGWKFVKCGHLYKKILSFNNYNIFATLAILARSQGSNILINWFFGTVVNGAFAIAKTVQGFVEGFTANFDQASAPRITQYLGANEKTKSQNIVYSICRYSILMMTLVFFPLFVEMDFMLQIWLGDVPTNACLFCKILLIVVMVASTSAGIVRYINASGNIKWFKLQSCFWYIIILPIGYWMFKKGFGPEWILILFVFSDVCNRITQLVLMKVLLDFNSFEFIKKAYLKPFVVIAIMFVYVLLYGQLCFQSPIYHFLGGLITLILTAVIIMLIGLNNEERKRLLKIVWKK